MKLVVKYTAVDPYYSDQIQTYIGSTPEEIDAIRSETEEAMARFHNGLLGMIYKTEIIFDSTFKP